MTSITIPPFLIFFVSLVMSFTADQRVVSAIGFTIGLFFVIHSLWLRFHPQLYGEWQTPFTLGSFGVGLLAVTNRVFITNFHTSITIRAIGFVFILVALVAAYTHVVAVEDSRV